MSMRPSNRSSRRAGTDKFDAAAIRSALDHGLSSIAVKLPPDTRTTLVAYLQMLVMWNKAYALSGVRDPLQMVSTHLLDSLVVLPHLSGKRCIDIGTGAGLPGLVLAIADPLRHWTLLDAGAKKVAFCRQAGFELGLPNIDAQHGRIENLAKPDHFDTATTRATFPPEESAELAHEFLREGGRLICMRGQADAPDKYEGYAVEELHRTPVPGTDERHLLILTKTGSKER